MRRPRSSAAVRRIRRPAWAYLLSRSVEPLSPWYGVERGGVVDRHLIEDFLSANRAAIHGRCLELLDDSYTRQFGRSQVASVDILDIDARNDKATIVGDLQHLDGVATGTFDCIILTQVLQFLPDPGRAVAETFRILGPGGTALVTVPTVSRIDGLERDGVGNADYWRFTPAGARLLFETCFPSSDLEVRGRGNVRTGLAFWVGMATEELSRRVLDHDDPAFPMLVTIRAQKSLTVGNPGPSVSAS